MKWFQWLAKKGISPNNSPAEGANANTANVPVYTGALPDTPVSLHLDENIQQLKSILGEQVDIIYRRIRLGPSPNNPACIVYIEGLVDTPVLNEDIIKSLMLFTKQGDLKAGKSSIRDDILNSVLTASNVCESCNIKQLVASVLSGEVILLVEGLNAAFLIDIKAHAERAISEPPSEVLVRGPREGFNETLKTNMTMIRRRIKHPRLRFSTMPIGRITATDVALVYIEGIAAPDLVNEVKQRLQRIDIDGVLESGYLEELIEDHPFSPFPQMHHTERPDRVAGSLLEGQVAILCDGSPFALIMPAQLASFINSPEDHYERYILSTALRHVRWISFGISLFLPSLYIAITTFHQEMIPTRLLVSISAYRQGLPFSTLIEALMMEFIFEVLREAGVRLPRAIGQAVSIAGALVIGQSAVTAGIVSPLMVIVVAATGIASFTIPSYSLGITIRLFRFPLMLLAGAFGLFGVSIGFILLVIHTVNLRSFSVPYLSPLAPLQTKDLKDILVRAPQWKMNMRPREYGQLNPTRMAPGLKPGPQQGSNNGGRKQT
jgi:spore germination protein KA